MSFSRNSVRILTAAGVLAVSISVAYAHVTVQPTASVAGATETYTLKVPTEKFVPTTRIEIELPVTLSVKTFESKPDWKIEEKKDNEGRIIGVVLTGSIPPGESASFKFTATNPTQEGSLSLKVIQVYQDGTKSEWTGAAGSRSPAPVIQIRK